MRNLRVRFQININTIEHYPLPVGRRYWGADTLEFHHVFEAEWTLLRSRRRPLSERRAGEKKTNYSENLHMFGFHFVVPNEGEESLTRCETGNIQRCFDFARHDNRKRLRVNTWLK